MALFLRTASALVRREGKPYEPDDDITAYWTDLLAQFGMTADEGRLATSPNLGYVDLAEEVLRALPTPVTGPDLLLLAYALPDVHPLKSVTAHLNYLLGGGSRCFAISEQGLRAPFTALRIADAYAQSGRCSSLALFVCDQTTLAYHDPLVHDTPLVDSAALLWFDGDGAFAYAGGRRASPDEDPADLVAAVAHRAGGGETGLVVTGPWLGDTTVAPAGWPVHRCTTGGYCTSVWRELARHHTSWAEQYPAVVLCDTDPRTGESEAAALRLWHSPTSHSLP